MASVFAVLLLAATSVSAQLVADGATNTLINVTNTFTGDVTVGTNGSFTLLVLSNNALLTNSANGVIGRNATAKSNEVRLLSASARWRMGNDLYVGNNGAMNRLVVSNGAFLANNNGLLGNGASSSNNFALVTGSGSFWSNRTDLTVGASGRDNQLIVSNGALVASRIGNLGLNFGSSNNLVVVTGNGSYWSNLVDLNVGVNERGNRLVIEAGGLAGCDNGRVGAGVFSDGSEALVTGPGSLWSIRNELAVGLNSANNRLVVSNGAAVVSGNNGRVGVSSPATGNQVLVTGAGSSWSNQFELYVGEGNMGNRLEVNSGGRVVSSNTYVGYQGAGNFALVTGASSLLSNRADLFVGHSSSANQLVVTNGGTVVNSNGYLGFNTSSSSNVALVTGAGSIWSNRSYLYVGLSGSGNRLVVSNGGLVQSLGGSIAFYDSSSNNEVIVTGAGSVWNSSNAVSLGDSGSGNRLVVSNGASVLDGVGYIGFIGDNNEVLVTGAGSSWSNRSFLQLGSIGSRNRLVVTNGGMVFSGAIFVNGASSRVVVDGGTLRATNAAGTSMLDVRRGTNVLNAGMVDVDQLVLTNRGTIPIPNVFGNSSSNHIPANGISGPASAYPSTIAVAGLAGLVTKVSVTLSNLTYEVPRNLDILLVSPGGQKVMLMSDAGSGFSVSNARLTFDDTAATLLPPENTTPIISGTYRPTDYEPGDTMPSPAPAGPYSTNLSSFNGINPNGDWSLYITRDSVGTPAFTDSLVGWGLQIEIEDLFFDPAVFEFNGGTLITRGASLNNGLPFVVGGPGGIPANWDARAGLSSHFVAKDLIVGDNSPFNQLLIPGGGVVAAGANVLVGRDPVSSTNNLLHVTGGTLRVLNPGTMLDVRGGTNRLDAGLVDVNRLVVTNTRGQFEFNGGTLRAPGTTVANGRIFTVGNGSSVATLQLFGGTHSFSNNLIVANNASLIGNGVVDGTVIVAAGGKLTPGAPIGRISVLGTVILQGAVNLQIDKSGGSLTNDQVTASGAIFYSGTLNVTDIGTDELTVGDRFPLFSATPYIGGFTTISLPPLNGGLGWTNKLTLDGSIEVIVVAVSQPKFSNISVSGTNVILSGTNGTAGANYAVLTTTNVATPTSNWVSLVTNQFGTGGSFSFTNPIAPGERQRYFRIRTP